MEFSISKQAGKVGIMVDFSEVEAAIASSKEAGKKLTDANVTKVAREFMHKVEQKTPVSTGRARSGWYQAVVGLKGSWSDRGSSPDMIELGKSEGLFEDVKKNNYDRYIYIENQVPYIMSLERGWSKQAPAGMLALTILEMQGKLKKEMLEGYRVSWYKGKQGKVMRIFRGATRGRSNILMPAF
jgi:hypothetical protein